MRKQQVTEIVISGFCRDLHLLYRSGISMGDGLLLMAEDAPEWKNMLEDMGRRVDEGALLSEVMEGSGVFPVYASAMIRVGEQTGRLEEALEAVADYYDRQERTRKQIKNALTYPLLLFFIMVLIIGVLLIDILPVFHEVYLSFGSRMTGIAGGLLLAGQILKDLLPLIGCTLAVGLGIGVFVRFHKNTGEKALRFWMKHCGDSGIFRKRNNTQFVHALSMGMRSGMIMEDAVRLAGLLLQEIPEAVRRTELCLKIMREGGSLAEALKKAEIITAAVGRRLEVGQKSGCQDEVMEEIALQLAAEMEEAVEHMTARIEPAMVICASVLVGMILLVVMLPLLNIMTALG